MNKQMVKTAYNAHITQKSEHEFWLVNREMDPKQKSCDEGGKERSWSAYESTKWEITGLTEVQHRGFEGDGRLEFQRGRNWIIDKMIGTEMDMMLLCRYGEILG